MSTVRKGRQNHTACEQSINASKKAIKDLLAKKDQWWIDTKGTSKEQLGESKMQLLQKCVDDEYIPKLNKDKAEKTLWEEQLAALKAASKKEKTAPEEAKTAPKEKR
ncbi:hypothetical protein ACMFMG_002914 [Clarireedia jacksonii]